MHLFGPYYASTELCHTYVVISENTLQEMLSNPHEFVSEVGTIVCFGR